MPDPRPDIDPRPIPEIVPQPEPPQPQPMDPFPQSPRETPPLDPPGEDPAPSFPEEFPADPGTIPTRGLRPQPVPPTPAGLPTSDAVHPHTSPMRNGDEAEVELDYNLPPEPLNDWNP